MSSAREVIAEICREFWDEGEPVGPYAYSMADGIISTLTTAGYRILGPDELDDVTDAEMWTGEGDGFKSFTLSQKVADRWRKGGLKVTEYRSLKGGRS